MQNDERISANVVQALEDNPGVRIASIDNYGFYRSDAIYEYDVIFSELPENWTVTVVPDVIPVSDTWPHNAWSVSHDTLHIQVGAVRHETGLEFVVDVVSSVAAAAIISFTGWAWKRWKEIRSSDPHKGESDLVIEKSKYCQTAVPPM